MVAITAGLGLGLSVNPTLDLGNASGKALAGKALQYLNAANGNLVLAGQEAGLTFDGLDLSDVRTYNSLGTGGDQGWLFGFGRKVMNLTGTVNTANSTVQRETDDGGVLTYSYNTTTKRYEATNEAGTVDLLTWDAKSKTWSWTDGESRQKEAYDSHGVLTAITDTRTGASFALTYTNNRLARIVAADGDALVFGYDTNGMPTSITSTSTDPNGGPDITNALTTYGYDSLHRLVSVTTALSQDGSDPAAGSFTTSYTYDGTSYRVTSMTQSDGLSVSYTYIQDGTTYRLSRVTSAMAGVVQDIQAIAYGTSTENGEAFNLVTVTDGAGQGWTYKADAKGLLRAVTSPAVAGQRQTTSYTYDAHGNVLTMTDPLGYVTAYTYDVRGNRLTELSPEGSLLVRTFNADNQVLTQTTYRAAVPTGTPVSGSTPETVRYVYDTSDRLCYMVDAAGGVTEWVYDSNGLVTGQRRYNDAAYSVSGLAAGTAISLTSMTNWIGARDPSKHDFVSFEYDLRGQLTKRVDWSASYYGSGDDGPGSVVTTYVYDATGLLRQQVTVRGDTQEITSYAYDGAGRLIGRVDPDGLRTTWIYTGDGQLIATAVDPQAGATVVTRDAYDARGNLVASTIGTGDGSLTRTTRNVYDDAGNLVAIVQPDGAVAYHFYDSTGQLVADVGPSGEVTRYTRDADGRITVETQYATAVDTRGWLASGVLQINASSLVTQASGLDESTSYVYDHAGRLTSTTNPSGTVTAYSYDAESHIIQKVTGTGAGARTERYFYDSAGRLIGSLNAEGYLTEFTYNPSGELVTTLGHALVSPAGMLASGTLAQLKPKANAADRTTTYIYDGLQRVVGIVDPDGYLTASRYDETAHTVLTVRSSDANESYRSFSVDAIISSIGSLPALDTTIDHFDSNARLIERTSRDGVVTHYTYDALGRLLTISQTEAGTTTTRSTRTYDGLGELLTNTDSLGRATSYTYDAAGREISRTDGMGNTTWTAYDAEGRVRFIAQGLADIQGRKNHQVALSDIAYDSFGHVVRQTTYATTAAFDPAGAFDTSTFAGLATSIANSAVDATVSLSYDAAGHLSQRTDESGAVTTFHYDAFDEVTAIDEPSRNGITPTVVYTYDRLGRVTHTTQAPGDLVRDSAATYDAFGDQLTATAAGGEVTAYEYDHLGQQTAKVELSGTKNLRSTLSYDSLGRIVSRTDALGATVQYTFDDVNRIEVVRSATGVTMTTVRDHDGDVVSVTDAAGRATIYTYDTEGELIATRDPLGNASTSTYDADGHVIDTVDAIGRRTAYIYDAGGRVLSQVVDPDGLALTTRWSYDARGRELTVTDPEGVVTRYTYGTTARSVQITHDVGGVAATETYTYDVDGNVLTAAVGSALSTQVTTYRYDGWGRLVEKVDDATGNPRSTAYAYDAENHVTATVRPDGSATYAAYDDAGNLVYTLQTAGAVGQGMGSLTRYWYDSVGNQTSTCTYGTLVSMAGVAADVAARHDRKTSNATFAALETSVSNGAHEDTYAAFNADGRLVYAVSRDDVMTSYTYDSFGRVILTVVSGYGSNGPTAGDSNKASIRNGVDEANQGYGLSYLYGANARYTGYVYDNAGRIAYSMVQGDTNGSVAWHLTRYDYDADGDVLATHGYSVGLPYVELQSVSVADVDAMLASAGGTVWTTRYVRDGAGRVIAQTDPDGATTFTLRDKDGNVTDTISPDGQETHVERDGLGRITSSRVSTTRVDTSGWLDSAGNATAALANYVYVGAASDDITATVYDYLGRVSSSTHTWQNTSGIAQGSRTTFAYDASGHVLSQVIVDVADPASARTTRYFYDAAGRLVGSLDPAGSLTTFTYDGAGNIIRSVRYATPVDASVRASGTLSELTPASWAADSVTVTFRDGFGNAVGELDADGYLTVRTYDAAGRVLTSQRFATVVPVASRTSLATATAAMASAHASSQTEAWTYNAQGAVTSYTDPHGATIWYTVDGLGQLTSEWKDGFTTGFQYDGAGHQVRSDAYGYYYTVTSTATYDASGRLQSSTDGVGNTSWFVYDAAGRLAFKVVGEPRAGGPANEVGDVTGWTYDAAGNVLDETHYASQIDLSGGGNLTASGLRAQLSAASPSVDVNGVVQYRYDAAGHVVWKNEGCYVTTFSYNGFGELVSQTEQDARMRATVYERDAAGRVVRTVVTAQAETGTVLTADDRWTFDALGRIQSHVDKVGHLENYTYDPLGQQTAHIISLAGGARTDTANYDAYGRTLTTTDAAGLATTYTYDDVANTITMTAPGGLVTVTTYDLAGHVTNITAADGHVVRYQYDTLGRFVETDYEDGREIRTLDADGRLVSFTDLAGHRTDYTYDAVGRVLTMIQDPLGLALTTVTRYSGMGQALTVTDPAGLVTVYTHDGAGRLVHLAVEAPAGVPGADDVTYAYDRDGHLIDELHVGGAETVRRYDVFGRLVYEQGPTSPSTSYRYDDAGNMIETASAGFRSYFFYNDAGEVLWEVDEVGTSSLAGDGSAVQQVQGARVIQTYRDNDGRVLGTTRYATLLSASQIAQLRAGESADEDVRLAALTAEVAVSPDDRSDYRVYDGAGRIAYLIDPTGQVTEYRYDIAGRLLDTLAHAKTVSVTGSMAASLRAGTETMSQVGGVVASAGNTDDTARRERRYYDVHGLLRFRVEMNTDLGGAGGQHVFEYSYDGDGRLTGEGDFGFFINKDQALSYGALDTISGELSRPAYLFHHVYDAAGREVFTVSGSGVVTQFARDPDGNVVAKVVYANTIDPWNARDGVYTLSKVLEANPNPSDSYVIHYLNDAQGRLLEARDDFHANPLESYTYDSRGNKASFIDAEGNTTVYAYDSRGWLTTQTSPAVTQTWFDAAGHLQSATASIVTTYAYGDDGQLLRQTVTGAGGNAAVTAYTRDSDGNVVAASVPGGSTSHTFRNAFGEAVVTQDVLGQFSYTVRDADGRVLFDIDAASGVTAYTYDGWGNATEITRFAHALNVGAQGSGWAPGIPMTAGGVAAGLVTSADDRTVTTTYDPFGRKLSVQLAAIDYLGPYGAQGTAARLPCSHTTRQGASRVKRR